MLAAQLSTWTATLVLMGALGRYLGDDGFGVLYLAATYAAIAAVLIEFGLNQQLVRAVARDREQAGAYLAAALAIKLSLFVVTYAGILAAAVLLGYSREQVEVIAVYCLMLVFGALSSSFLAVYQACERILHSSIGGVIEKASITAAALVLLSQGRGVVAVAAVYVVGASLSAAWQAFFIRRLISLSPRLDTHILVSQVKGAVPFLAYSVLASVYFRLDVIVLSKFAGTQVVGWYGAAYRLFDTLVFLPGMISSTIMYPILARASVQSERAMRETVARGVEAMVVLGLPVCVGLFTLAAPVLELVYRREEFLAATPSLQWLSVGLMLLYLNHIFTVTLWSLHLEGRLIPMVVAAGVLNLSANWLLIPHYGHVAAAAVTAATEAFLFCYLVWQLPKGLLSRSSLAVAAKAAASAGAMVAALRLASDQPVVLLVPLGALTYLAAALAVRLLKDEDVRMVMDALALRRQEPAGAGAVEA